MNRPLIGCSSLAIRNRCCWSSICELHIHLDAGTCISLKQTCRVTMLFYADEHGSMKISQRMSTPWNVRVVLFRIYCTRYAASGDNEKLIVILYHAIKLSDQQKFESNLSILFMHQWAFNKLLPSGIVGHATNIHTISIYVVSRESSESRFQFKRCADHCQMKPDSLLHAPKRASV